MHSTCTTEKLWVISSPRLLHTYAMYSDEGDLYLVNPYGKWSLLKLALLAEWGHAVLGAGWYFREWGCASIQSVVLS